MSELITVSSENKQYLDSLKRPGETYDDVIEMLLEDYKIDYTGWSELSGNDLKDNEIKLTHVINTAPGIISHASQPPMSFICFVVSRLLEFGINGGLSNG